MTQQINLYQPILRQQKKVFSAAALLQMLGAFALLMLSIYAFSHWQLRQLERENHELQARQAALATRIAMLSRELQMPAESRELRRQVEAAERELELKRRLSALLEQRPMSGAAGFSEAIAGLARQRVQGLWLTGVTLGNEGEQRRVTLQGRTVRAELVPQLVQQLGAEPAFQGLQFRRMRVFQPDDASDGDVLAFELTTRPPEVVK